MNTGTLALVVARGGSKGIPRKNLRPVGGQPLIVHTLLAARASRLLSRTILSTDDPEIADIAGQHGTEVPFMRPSELARDDSHIMDVTLHALEWLERGEGYCPERVMLLQPTSPFRTAEDIDGAIRMALEADAPAVVSVCEARRHPCLAKRLEADGSLRPFVDSDLQTRRRQELPPAYDLNGAIYLVRREILCSERSWCPRGARAYVMPPERSLDVDSPWDLRLADLLMRTQETPGLRAPVSGGAAARRAVGFRAEILKQETEGPTPEASPMATLTIGHRRIGEGAPCFVIAEAGVNHNGDPDLARRLVEAAARAGADAVKFQTFHTDRLATPDAPKADYQCRATGCAGSQYDMLKGLELAARTHEDLIEHSRRQGILFLSTPFDEESADLLDALGVPAFKIGSGDLTNLLLLRHVARKGKPVILSTGMAGLSEVRSAVAALREAGLRSLGLLHCVSNYPADPADANLRAMHALAAEFHVPVGFSDHTPNAEVALAAVALGACVLEKHFTLDRTLPGPDHRASLDPGELAGMIRAVRAVESALGDGVKRAVPSEAGVAAAARRSIVASRAIPAGALLCDADLAIKRPGTGLPSSRLPSLLGRRVRQDVAAGALIRLEMLA